jgi:two-component system, LytTR family, sensor kinase
MTPSVDSHDARRLRRVVGASIVGVALLLAGLEASQLYFRMSLEGWRTPERAILARAVASWMTLAALTPLVLALARRFRVPGGGVLGYLVHGASAVVFTATHLVVTAWMLYVAGIHPFLNILRYLLVSYAALDLLLYGAILAARAAWEALAATRARELAIARLESSLREAELRRLRDQLHPHFLFNALNTIGGLALTQSGPRVVEAIGHLGAILRASLDGDRHDVTLEDELAALAHYVAVQQMRYEDRLKISTAVTAGTEAFRVPRMLLQPLVENAIQHGMPSDGRPLVIRVEARPHPESGLLIAVEDDGIGRGDGAPRGGAGIGLTNLRERLASLYGANADVALHLTDTTGARVTVHLPDAAP